MTGVLARNKNVGDKKCEDLLRSQPFFDKMNDLNPENKIVNGTMLFQGTTDWFLGGISWLQVLLNGKFSWTLSLAKAGDVILS